MEYTDNGGNKIKAETLKPCPFCGNQPELHVIGNDHTKSRKVTVKCKKCRIQRTNAALRHNHEWLIKVSVREWNERI